MEEFVFSEDYEEDKLLLFEFPSEELLKEVLEGKTKIEFVSNVVDPLVLCTENKTYDILEFDTSNLLLVHDDGTVLSGNSSTFELREKAPPFLSIRRMLHDNPITEAEIKGQLIENPNYVQELQNTTLCSIGELNQILIDLCAITVDGAVKTPTKNMENLIIDQILQYSRTLNDWKRINIDDCLKEVVIPLIDYQPMKDIYYAVIKYYSFEIEERVAILDEKKIIRHIAEFIFRKARNGFLRKSEFEEEMSEYMPENTKIDYDMLHGMFVTKLSGIQFVDEEALPISLLDRFEALFKIHDEWEIPEIEPFFEYFVTDSLPFQDLAARHCRFADGKWMRR
ncbi:Sister chromatid cohesion protein DCC1 [Tritrichomonas musculus]|uniref:Sister chromatid cohesion protein DCC1 n=1 Tax=Tritrichomonas musculus TaxID=1915356 RepID=A0ABR2KGT3_9EUKA